jgi:hypothetical protein
MVVDDWCYDILVEEMGLFSLEREVGLDENFTIRWIC